MWFSVVYGSRGIEQTSVYRQSGFVERRCYPVSLDLQLYAIQWIERTRPEGQFESQASPNTGQRPEIDATVAGSAGWTFAEGSLPSYRLGGVLHPSIPQASKTWFNNEDRRDARWE